MDTYILHVYRRERTSPGRGRLRRIDRVALVGVLEVAGTQRRIAFRDVTELWELLQEDRSRGKGDVP